MTKNNTKTMYSSPRLEVLGAGFEDVLCTSNGATTEQFNDYSDFEW